MLLVLDLCHPSNRPDFIVVEVSVPAERARVIAALVQRAQLGRQRAAEGRTAGRSHSHVRRVEAPQALRASRVADAADVNHETPRTYERRGLLLAGHSRSPGGHRLYRSQAVTVLRVIKAAQRLGSLSLRSLTCWRLVGTATEAAPTRDCKLRRR